MTFNIMVHSTHQKTNFFDDIKLSGEPKKSMVRAFREKLPFWKSINLFINEECCHPSLINKFMLFQNGNFSLTVYSIYLLKS